MDKKKTIEYIVIGACVVGLIAILPKYIGRGKKKTKPKKPAAVSVDKILAPETAKPTEADEDIIAKQEEFASRPWGRDPFFFAKTKKLYKGESFALKGISLGPKRKGFAFINDEVLSVGEEIEGYTILEIQRTRVLLKKGGDSFYLSMPEE